MQLNILDFLTTLEAQATATGQLLVRVREEIATFRNIRESLSAVPGGSGNHPADRINNYLEDLELVAKKLKFTHMILFVSQEKEVEAEINKILLRILKKLNHLQEN